MTSTTATTPTSASRSLPTAEELKRVWREGPRWRGVRRACDASDALRLRGTVAGGPLIAPRHAEKHWRRHVV